MEAIRAVLSEILGQEAAAEVDAQDLSALHEGGYRNKRKIELATRPGLERAGVKPALVDELLNALAGEQTASTQPAASCKEQPVVTSQSPARVWQRQLVGDMCTLCESSSSIAAACN